MRFLNILKTPLCAVAMYMVTTAAMAAPYVIEGFRSAKFGMGKNQVISSIKTDFNVQDNDILRDINAEDGTDLLIVEQPGLSVFLNNPTTITYTFGHKSKQLMAVNVAIISNDADTQQGFLKMAVETLVPFFRQNDLSEYKVIGNFPVEERNAVVLFGLLPKSEEYPQALEISLSNVAVQQQENQVFVDVESGNKDPVVLRISYLQSLQNMDVGEIKKDDF